MYHAAAERCHPHDGPSPHDAMLPDHISPVNGTSIEAPAGCPYAIPPASPHCEDAFYTWPHDIIRVAIGFHLHDTHGDLDRRWTGQQGWTTTRWVSRGVAVAPRLWEFRNSTGLAQVGCRSTKGEKADGFLLKDRVHVVHGQICCKSLDNPTPAGDYSEMVRCSYSSP